MSDIRFALSSDFVAQYQHVEPKWGWESGPNSLGEIVYMENYSRVKPDGTKEMWWESVRRVVEGTYTIQMRHCYRNDVFWDIYKAERSAEEMFDRMFNFKFLPPGRGISTMGTDYVLDRWNAAPLQNCAFISTTGYADPTYPFVFLMDMSMLGVGVGFDTTGVGTPVYQPRGETTTYVIPDSREGWVESQRLLLASYFTGLNPVDFDYSDIRPKGQPIRGFGGIAPGPEPLRKCHENTSRVMHNAYRMGHLTESDIVDIFNIEGACVVAGGVRRSAEVALGTASPEFLDLKNYEKNPNRTAWGWVSNNSVVIDEDDEPDFEAIAERIAINGEPGVAFINNARKYARMNSVLDTSDFAVKGFNPCMEQPLESGEVCCLVDVFPTNCENKEDYLRTLKFAYLYAKTVTLMDTHNELTNEIVRRNRRIGTSFDGVVQFVHRYGRDTLVEWAETGYDYIQELDRLYSGWLKVNESIRTTTEKPGGTVPLLAGATPATHYPEGDYIIRRVRIPDNSPLVGPLTEAGYYIEQDTYADNTLCVEIPVKGEGLKNVREVSIFEKADLATLMAKHWADNAVSVTVSFMPHERGDVVEVLKQARDTLKTISFLPIDVKTYAQMPYEAITPDEYERRIANIKPVDFQGLTSEADVEIERFCETDVCEVRNLIAV